MATLNVCCRLLSKTERFQVSLPSLEDTVHFLVNEICNRHLKSQVADVDIIYCGQLLDGNKSLSSYNLQHQSTVYVVPKSSSPSVTDGSEPKNEGATASKRDVLKAIQSALLNDEYRQIVERMLSDAETVENIIVTTPGLDKDPAVLAMLQDPELLAVLAHPNNMDSLLQLHPSFAQAAMTVATAVNEECSQMGLKSGTRNVTYSMDQMSDDDDDEDGSLTPQARRRRGNPGRNITASQLAAALQAATAPGQASSSLSPPSQGVPGASGTITSDFFQQAMAHAQSASTDAALQQLREMGITDENVARQALAAAGGNVQAAIDLIFGDGFSI